MGLWAVRNFSIIDVTPIFTHQTGLEGPGLLSLRLPARPPVQKLASGLTGRRRRRFIRIPMVLTQEEIDACRTAFQAMDRDRSGTIDVWQLRQVGNSVWVHAGYASLFKQHTRSID